MFDNIIKFFKRFSKEENKDSKDTAKERLHLVLMQDRANVSADFLELMRQEIIEVIKKYIEVDERAIEVRLTNKENSDGTVGAPALYANIPIVTIKDEPRKVNINKEKVASEEDKKEDEEKETSVEESKEDKKDVEESEKENTEKADKKNDTKEETKEVENETEIEEEQKQEKDNEEQKQEKEEVIEESKPENDDDKKDIKE